MKRIKFGLLTLVVMLMTNFVYAQTVDEAKKMLYYERFESAKNMLKQILATNPSNSEAAYYMGLAEIGLENVTGAKEWFNKQLQSNPNDALLLAGLGNVLLLEGKSAEAKSKFETAISLSKGTDLAVLNAVGYANSNPDIKNGDARYAVDVLTKATQTKKFKDAEIMTNLGDAYRKLGDGGNAVLSYEAALKFDPSYARALYRKGRVYQSQGANQEQLFIKLYQDAIAADSKYAPVYLNLFNYYYSTNVTLAAEYLDKWLRNTDDDPKACYYRASMKFAQGLFSEAISSSDACIQSEGENAYPNLFGLKAISYLKLKDTVAAKASYEQFFKVQAEDKIGAGDYATYALLLSNDTLNDHLLRQYTQKAIDMDSIENNRANYIKNIAKVFENRQNYTEAASWYAQIMKIKRNYSNVDLFNAGYNYYLGNAMDSAVIYFGEYAKKYPNDLMGHYMLGNAYAIIDSTGDLGLAVPHYEKTIELGEADTTKPNVKTRLITSYRFFIGYYYNNKKDKENAMKYIDKALLLAPNDEQLLQFKEFVSKNDPKKSGK